MARVCQDWFPNEKNPEKSGFYMDDTLKANIDALLKNAERKQDWSFTGLITGSGRTRVGKSVLMLQILTYWRYQLLKLYNVNLPFTIKDNIIFRGDKLIETGNRLGKDYPQSCIGYDEAGFDLQSVKFMKSNTQDVKDFLREAGQYNFFLLLVLPDFFDLPKGIALNGSDFLIDVFALPDSEGRFVRGYFNFYSRPNKKLLYLKGKKELNYKAHPYDFHGRFYNFYPVDEQEYRKSKLDALQARGNEKRDNIYIKQRDILFKILEEAGMSMRDVSLRLRRYGIPLTHQAISHALSNVKRLLIENSMCELDDVDDDEQEGD